jgi:ELWxxDGT repeat protein
MQQAPSMTNLSDGGFVVTWQGFNANTSSVDIYGQRYQADGSRQGGEFLINTTVANTQSQPTITDLTDGGFVVTWSGLNPDNGSNDIYSQRFDANGVAVQSVIQLSPATAGSTSLVNTGPQFILNTNQTLYVADDGINGRELWITDGTAAGTHLLKDINTGILSSNPDGVTTLGNGKAIFQANNGSNGYELWVTDGTAAGTNLLKDINIGLNNAFPNGFTALGNGKVIFQANDGVNGNELWITDGTAAGTSLVKDLYIGSESANPDGFTALGNGKAIFQANDGVNGIELWITDGTAAGTSLVKDLNIGVVSANPGGFTALGNGQWLFTATDAHYGQMTWITDGTNTGTRMLYNNSAPSFSIGDGKVTTDLGGSNDYGQSVTVQADGKILVAGYSWNGANNNFALTR